MQQEKRERVQRNRERVRRNREENAESGKKKRSPFIQGKQAQKRSTKRGWLYSKVGFGGM